MYQENDLSWSTKRHKQIATNFTDTNKSQENNKHVRNQILHIKQNHN